MGRAAIEPRTSSQTRSGINFHMVPVTWRLWTTSHNLIYHQL
jgi:hypothetical protein